VTRQFNKTSLRLTILSAIILLLEITFSSLFPHWTFKTGTLIICNKLIIYLSIFVLIICSLLLFRAASWLTISLGLIFLIFFGVLSCSEIYPIDTTTEPVDIKTIQTYTDGKKLVARQYENAKTNAVIKDTVLVKDIFIFRQVYDK